MAKLYIGNLPYEVTDESLQQLFSSHGFQLLSARVIRDMATGRSRGFGFAEVATSEEMTQAISQLNGFTLEGHALQVSEARPQAPRGERGGYGGGRGGHRGGHHGGHRRRF